VVDTSPPSPVSRATADRPTTAPLAASSASRHAENTRPCEESITVAAVAPGFIEDRHDGSPSPPAKPAAQQAAHLQEARPSTRRRDRRILLGPASNAVYRTGRSRLRPEPSGRSGVENRRALTERPRASSTLRAVLGPRCRQVELALPYGQRPAPAGLKVDTDSHSAYCACLVLHAVRAFSPITYPTPWRFPATVMKLIGLEGLASRRSRFPYARNIIESLPTHLRQRTAGPLGARREPAPWGLLIDVITEIPGAGQELVWHDRPRASLNSRRPVPVRPAGSGPRPIEVRRCR